MKKFALLILISLIFTSCGGGGEDTIPSKTLEELLAAPEEIQIDGQTYELSSYLWRDFMPGTTDSSLRAVVTISEKNLIEIPSGMDATYLWVINENEIWSTSFSDEPRPHIPAYQFTKIARGGPEWDIGISVDVVVNIIDGTGGEYLLKISNQLIQSTW